MPKTEKKKSGGAKNMDTLLKDINTEFGEGTAFKLGNSKPVPVDVISTGSFSLDLALGVGGLPRGRIVEIYGPESSGKTSLALSVVAQAQKLGGQAVYVDAEHALDLEYAAKLGVNVKELTVSQPKSGEEALNLVHRFVQSESVMVVVLDSVAALVPMAEDEGNIGQSFMGLQARMMSQAMRKLTGVIAKTNTLVIFINQIRMKIGQMGWGSPETTSGGMALKFHASVRIDVRRIGKIQEGDEIVGNNIRAKVVKNKVAAPFKQAEFYLMFANGLSYEADIFNTAVKNSVIVKKGMTFYFGEEKLDVGAAKATEKLKSDPKLLEAVTDKIRATLVKVQVDNTEE